MQLTKPNSIVSYKFHGLCDPNDSQRVEKPFLASTAYLLNIIICFQNAIDCLITFKDKSGLGHMSRMST